MLQVELIADAEFGEGPWRAVVMTSANAARAIAEHSRRGGLLGRPVFTVGRRTAEAARAAGFSDVTAAAGDKEALVRLVGEGRSGGDPILYLAGEERSGDLAGNLAARGFLVQLVEVYRAVQATRFPAAVEAALVAGAIDAVLHFSRRSTEAFIGSARAAGILDAALKPAHYCLSGQVAEPLRPLATGPIRIPVRPEEIALLDLIAAA
jgi:uroporphyrinogen-III synthase